MDIADSDSIAKMGRQPGIVGKVRKCKTVGQKTLRKMGFIKFLMKFTQQLGKLKILVWMHTILYLFLISYSLFKFLDCFLIFACYKDQTIYATLG